MKATNRRYRRTAKQVLRFGPKAKRPHKRIAGRTGSIRAKRIGSRK